jgi:hypothetical protein
MMREREKMEVQLHSFLTVVLAGVERSSAYTGRSQPLEIDPITTE